MKLTGPFVGFVLAAASVDIASANTTTQASLADQIEALSQHYLFSSRHRADLIDCQYISYRRDVDLSGRDLFDPTPIDLNAADILMSVVTVDLRTAEIGVPQTLAPFVTPASDGGTSRHRVEEGSAIVYPDEDTGWLHFIGTHDAPHLFEEPVHRDRTQLYIDAGDTWPSDRDDGASFVFRHQTQVFLKYQGAIDLERLRQLETALIAYQSQYCQARS
ncbi:MAG: hypothetical protein AAF386_09510 [Pseudomonadota bacterium]